MKEVEMLFLVVCEGREYYNLFEEIPCPNGILDGRDILNEELKKRVLQEFHGLAGVKFCGAAWRPAYGELPQIEIYPLRQLAFAGV
ncbi:hypothetical protein A2473_01890 [candidate division WWE3 bacterium RIFOXYC2_FULL_42_13]|uniref:Uncharacterized protein n=2 Tax=Katanobacteria TaxID=422282 RepID=A0A3D0ZPZ7_UNCKA|nr:MAG: hypothetical protein A2245_02975 [candidate division WWE3 bacterium RIFOXYA2_FULL_43_12]OGC65590.1 MAG: hypothetical protein A2274_02445 [candidate division WWE3 bacterium RIFOXYA12_FULL_43_11]OGC72727.1 MAG: hypothetical protein A2337_00170 [candidate division WWE3 bacterium RIFOXYB2_FULL_43_9]OGC73776.1 MAG: hypothetical protein A2473_01890 [candidate division WWE3 bacterium RIFOXYC2_FULL_42_13]OGC75322.1 MAG: hypothetical protein A2547_03845 [candidate division WWE3 bacterium RIFOXYD